MTDLTQLLQAAREFGEWPETEKYRLGDFVQVEFNGKHYISQSAADAALTELLAAVVELDRMLRLAFEDAYPMHGDTYDSGGIYRRWLADLRARIREE